MSPHHSDQTSQRSQVCLASKINSVWGRSLKVFVCQKIKVLVPGGYLMVPGGYLNKGVLLTCSGQLKMWNLLLWSFSLIALSFTFHFFYVLWSQLNRSFKDLAILCLSPKFRSLSVSDILMVKQPKLNYPGFLAEYIWLLVWWGCITFEKHTHLSRESSR